MITRLVKAFGYSLDGMKAAYRDEPAFRQECWAALVLVPLAFVITIDSVERVLLIGSLLLVMLVELLNSAIEAVVDRISTEHHMLAKKAKDCGSAAVLVGLIIAGLCWALIAYKHL